MSRTDLERLVCAGVVSRSYSDWLVHDPLRAVDAGYYGEHFSLTTEEREFLANIRAGDFDEFVRVLAEWIQQHYPRLFPASVVPHHRRCARTWREDIGQDSIYD